ncbi:MAG: putative transposase, partial [Gammaproteobacteria bacterium]
MKENNVVELSGRVEAGDALTAMLRSGAQELIRQAVDAELQDLLASHAARITDEGR